MSIGNIVRACKHYLICAQSGYEPSLKQIQICGSKGYVSKNDYAEALRAFQKQHDDTKSEMREEALVYKANPLLYYKKN